MSDLKIFNSLTRQKENFRPKQNRAGIYVCGITPYDVTHLGHAFTYVFFDVVVRYLRFLGYKVVYVQNLTDIDDDILKRAKKEKKNWRGVVKVNTRKFLEDLKWLNCQAPDFYPRATDHVLQILAVSKKLLQKKMAYQRRGSVYFDVSSDKSYGELSKLSKKEMLPIANERGNNPKDTNKTDPLDFVLWQAKERGEPSWTSPWGQGRPGWHIECTAMASKYLGKSFDIQGGGADLIFPHHESTIAQSEYAFSKRPHVKYWMHTGMLRYKKEKMSKSLGNLVLVGDLKRKYSANTVRILLLSHNYRSPFEYFAKELREAKKADRLLNSVWQLPSSGAPFTQIFDTKAYHKEFFAAMNNDFDTPKAVNVLKKMAALLLKNRGRKNISQAKDLFFKTFNILGLSIEY